MKEKIGDFSLDDLKKIHNWLEECNSMDYAIERLKMAIRKKEEKRNDINNRFDMNLFLKYRIFTSDELEVLKKNNISTMQELIDADLEMLKGISPSIIKSLDWARKFYDMEDFSKKVEKAEENQSIKK